MRPDADRAVSLVSLPGGEQVEQIVLRSWALSTGAWLGDAPVVAECYGALCVIIRSKTIARSSFESV